MSKSFKPPGSYIEDLHSLSPVVKPVETSIPAFIGYTEKAEMDGASLVLRPTRISSLEDFKVLFGGKSGIDEISVIVDENRNFKVKEIQIPNNKQYYLYDSLRLFFDNGGRDCYIVSVGFYGTPPAYGDETDSENIGFRNGLKALENYDVPTLILFPDAVNVVNDGSDDPGFYSLQQMALQQCGNLQDRFCILDLKENIKEDHEMVMQNFRDHVGSSHLKFGAGYSPFLISNYSIEPELSSFENNIFNSVGEPVSLHELSASSANSDLVNAYFNAAEEVLKKAALERIYREHQVISEIVEEIKKKVSTIPTSGAMAGIYAQIDHHRGVWKTPANVSLNSVKSLSVAITTEMQVSMNVDINGKSINAIRFFPGKGIMVWGARTLAGNDNEWRYIPVRLLINMVQESVKNAGKQFIFEPNTKSSWITLKAMIENFLIDLWRKGALMGAKPEDAYFVKVGLGETMTAQDILEGWMILEIGLAVVRPAEFIIIRVRQQMAES